MRLYLVPRKLAFALAGSFLGLTLINMTGLASFEKITGVIPGFCPFHAVTGILCPGCGMTRAIVSLTGGNISEAFFYNPFSFFLVFMVSISMVPEKWMGMIRVPLARVMPAIYVSVLSLVLTFWVFDRLIPHLAG
ncbi:MAG: DUF2752 domain-containing protein [Syntrophorhabdaceae bacterium]